MALKKAGFEICMLSGLLSATRYVSANDEDPGEDGAGELAAGRAAVLANVWDVSVATGIAINNSAIMLPSHNLAQADPIWAALHDVAVGGNVLFTALQTADVAAPEIGAPVRWPIGMLDISIETTAITIAGAILCLQGGLVNRALYLSKHSGDPGMTGDDEVTGQGDPRVAVAMADWTYQAGDNHITLTAEKSFANATAAQDDITWLGLNTALVGGHLVWRKALGNNPDAPAAGFSVVAPGDSLNISIATDD